jgi:hypothetical protein
MFDLILNMVRNISAQMNIRFIKVRSLTRLMTKTI